MRNYIFKSIFASVILLGLNSCGVGDQPQASSLKEENYQKNLFKSETNRPPEIIPTDTGLETLISNPETRWNTYDSFYKEVVLELTDKPYFRNLQIKTISMLTTRSKGFEDVPASIVDFYLFELNSREFINDPNTIFSLANVRFKVFINT